MFNHDPALESLVSNIQETTDFLSILISRKTGLALLVAVCAAIVLKLAL